jgi:hypothetical protein
VGEVVQGSFPYGGERDPNSGFIKGGSSEDRARSEDNGGVTALRQRETLVALDQAGPMGLTWQELARIQGWHHGQASGALSGLHKTGRIVRLTLRRKRCAIYVASRHVNGRATEKQGETETTRMLREAVDLLGLLAPSCRHRAADPDLINCTACRANHLIRHYEQRSK